VKLFGEFDRDEGCEIVKEIEKLINVTHPCIAAPFGFVLPTASKELKIARLYSRSGSLKDVLSARPLWRAPAAKAIAVAGIVLALKLLYSFGLIHGHLTPSNVLSMNLIEFKLQTLDEVELIRVKMPRLRAEWRQNLSACERVEIPRFIPEFVSGLIESGLSANPRERPSFDDISEALNKNAFRIADAVESAEVSAFVSLVESSET
jgi:hypothetical protein